jgi:hypothetical protein
MSMGKKFRDMVLSLQLQNCSGLLAAAFRRRISTAHISTAWRSAVFCDAKNGVQMMRSGRKRKRGEWAAGQSHYPCQRSHQFMLLQTISIDDEVSKTKTK